MNTLKIQPVTKQLPVFTTILHNHQELNSYLKEVISEHRKLNPKSNESNVQAWHSNWQTHEENTNFQPIIDLVLSACEFVSGYYNDEIKFKCYNLWAIEYEKGDYAKKHSHYPADFAVVYYVDVEPGCSPIIFEDELKIFPENGMLVIFPGVLEHEIPETNVKRTVISMNIHKK